MVEFPIELVQRDLHRSLLYASMWWEGVNTVLRLAREAERVVGVDYGHQVFADDGSTTLPTPTVTISWSVSWLVGNSV